MISQNPLSIKDRQFSGAFARSVCAYIYGDRLHSGTYRNWRSWAGIPRGERFISYEQFCRLVAIAYLRKRQSPEDRVTELRESDISTIVESVEMAEMVAQVVQRFDDLGWVIGRDAPIALKVSRSTLYRNVPGFSTVKVYRIAYLRDLCAA